MSTNPYLQILNLIQNNKQNEASDLMNKLSSSQINNPILYNLNGLNLIKAGKYSESVEQFKKAIEIDKFYSDPFYNLGQLYYKLGNFSNAIEYLNEASKLKKILYHAIFF
jgi:tetratricopeptide (TPR) repeat protein